MKPAAIGMGIPRKSVFLSSPSGRGIAARQLNRARRMAPQSRYEKDTAQPIHSISGGRLNKTALDTSKAGAIPKEITSAMESNSLPKGDSCPPSLASLPSKRSKIQDPKMKKIAFS